MAQKKKSDKKQPVSSRKRKRTRFDSSPKNFVTGGLTKRSGLKADLYVIGRQAIWLFSLPQEQRRERPEITETMIDQTGDLLRKSFYFDTYGAEVNRIDGVHTWITQFKPGGNEKKIRSEPLDYLGLNREGNAIDVERHTMRGVYVERFFPPKDED
jgi:hypothetical protein